MDDVLYKRDCSVPLLKCLNEEAQYVLRDIHEGMCRNHSGGQSLAHKIIRQGYFWPTIRRDVLNFVKKCDKCQRLAHWPFAKWGVDLIWPMSMGEGGVRFAIVVVDYFTKWAEAEPLPKIIEQKITNFIWKHIICGFGIPHLIVTDNEKPITLIFQIFVKSSVSRNTSPHLITHKQWPSWGYQQDY